MSPPKTRPADVEGTDGRMGKETPTEKADNRKINAIMMDFLNKERMKKEEKDGRKRSRKMETTDKSDKKKDRK